MRRPRALALGGAALVLALIVLVEGIAGEVRLARIAGPVRAARLEQQHPAALGEIGAPAEAVDEWVKTALARPLMTASRKPAAAAEESGLSLANGLPRLTGTIVKADGGVAIFARDDSGHPLIVREGGVMGPYRIIHINADSVTLAGPAGVQTLRPRFGDARSLGYPGPIMPGPMTMPGIGPPMPGMPQPMLGVPQPQIDGEPG